MKLDLQDRVALVTGGARGIGLAIAEHFIAAGARVVIADNGVSIAGTDPDAELVAQIGARLGERALALAEDVAAPQAAERLVAIARERFGALDILVNNAAILRDGFIFKTARADWEEVLRVNLGATLACCAAAAPLMREQARAGRAPGRIVNIVSTAGLYGNFGQSAYAAAKAGIVGLTRVVAMDMQRSLVTCNALAPFAATRVTDSIKPANEIQERYKAHALTVSTRHVARAVGFLAAESAGAITGQLFGVRGRELFLFSQPRPTARIELPESDGAEADLASLVQERFGAAFTDLGSDLEAFSSEPIV